MDKKIKSYFFLFFIFFSFSLFSDSEFTRLKEAVCQNLPLINGWCSQEKAINFIDLILEEKPKVCVEIGVFGGSSLFPTAMALKFLGGERYVIGIDPWKLKKCLKEIDPQEKIEHYNWWSKVNLEEIYQEYIGLIQENELEDYCITFKMSSKQAASYIFYIDILHIDGSHTSEGSKKDVSLYLPKVKKGGYIWMNDCLWQERQEAINLLLEQCEVVKIIEGGNCVLFKKI